VPGRLRRCETAAAARHDTTENVLQMNASDVRPLIAVTTSEVRRMEAVAPTPQGEPAQHEMALGLKYLQALERAGAIPIVCPPLPAALAESLLERVDGLCMSGGPDLDPAAYGERRHVSTGPVESQLDEFELALARAADARGLPILAICRGMQVLNVARGGSLHQHLPDLNAGEVNHRQTAPGSEPTHPVSIRSASRVARVLERTHADVNSFHHQGVARLGEGLVITGRAPDGTVEAIEAMDREFVLGVQWHAETLQAQPEQKALFVAFVDSARALRAGATRLRVA
jgi:putative glutamine amidotransferase